MLKVYVDGQAGTTGLQIHERLQQHPEVEILSIDPAERKDPRARQAMLNRADVAFLCLPDDAAREAVRLADSGTRLIDASTAHRVDDNWAFGLPEISEDYRTAIRNAHRVANPGCHATGFIALVAPLVAQGVLPAATPLSCQSVTGYSGGGKALIQRYEEAGDAESLSLQAPRHYALTLTHKHLPEMQKHTGISVPPVFSPIVGPYYRGMTVTVPLHTYQLLELGSAAEVRDRLADYYTGSRFVTVMPHDAEGKLDGGFMDPQAVNGTNQLQLFVFGNDQHIQLAARLDNLGKGASGAAVQNMNIMFGLDEGTGLE